MNHLKVVGLTSWGEGCESEYPGVYARISVVRWWVKNKICRFSRDKGKIYFCKKKDDKKRKWQKQFKNRGMIELV